MTEEQERVQGTQGEPQEGNTPEEGQKPIEGEGQEPEPQRFDAEYVRKLRSEAAQYRKKLRDLEKALKAKEEAELSEQERLQKRVVEYEAKLAELERERQERTLQYEVKLRAAKLGIVDPDAAWRLVDLAAIEFNEDGIPLNIEDVLKDLLKAKPYLRGTPAAPPMGATNPERKRSTNLTRESLKKMSPEEINQHWEEISRFLSEGR